MAIVRLPSDSGPAAADRAASIVPYLRRIDRVWAEHGDVNLLLPDTDRTAAERLVDPAPGPPARCGRHGASIATFPVDGLTSGALLAALYGTPLPAVPVPVGVGPARRAAGRRDRAPTAARRGCALHMPPAAR